MSDHTKLWCVMPAAGVGARMQANRPKQYLALAGKTVIEHSLNLLLNLKQLEMIKLCLSPEDAYIGQLDVIGGRVSRENGGETRAQSVLNGLRSLNTQANDADWVLVHDAARPCLDPMLLERLVSQLEQDAIGGILAIPAKDTLKLSRSGDEYSSHSTDEKGAPIVSRTLNRALVWQAQTPQMFRYGLLLSALEAALDSDLRSGLDITDEASAMEAAGHEVKLIEGSAQNIKITTPEDLALAEFLLARHK